MKKFFPYILGALLLTALIILFYTGNNTSSRRLDKRITLRKTDKIPYGTFVAYQNLEHIFPDASISTNRYEPGNWDSISKFGHDQAIVIVARKFNASEDEMRNLIRFAENGNDVFISAWTISFDAEKMLECSINEGDIPIYFEEDGFIKSNADTMTTILKSPPYKGKTKFIYPGYGYQSNFSNMNPKIAEALGTNESGETNFIHLKAGKGNFYLHLSPLSFSNYFLLHKDNIGYYEKAISVINPEVKKLVWDEYYLYKREYDQPESKKGWFSILMGMKNEDGKHSFRAAFWLLIGLLVVLVLMEMRRKQRYIPVIAKPRNDSLDFVKTIGRLYYDRADHKNLSRKMAAYFLEHVRQQYKLPTSKLDDEFVRNLQYKSGVGEIAIRELVSFIKYLDDASAISAIQLRDFHKKLEQFYSKA